jgi:hypothetical protein
MTRAQYDDMTEQDYDPIVFHDGRGDFDSSLLDESLDCFALSIDALD